MGKHANQSAYREWERLQDKRQDAHLDDEPPLTEFEKAAEWYDKYFDRLDDVYPRTDRHLGGFA